METRRKAKRLREPSPESESKKRRMEDKIDRLLQEVSETKKDLGEMRREVSEGRRQVMDMVNAQIEGVNDKIDDVRCRVGEIGDEVNDLTRRVDDIERTGVRNGDRSMAYWKARRSIRIGPIEASDEKETWDQLRCLFRGELGMSAWETQCLEIEMLGLGVRRMRGGSVVKMAKVVFESIADRDRIFTLIPNASPEVRLEMVVPDFLVGRFRNLESKAYEERKKGKKTVIRFDDVNMDLRLEVRDKTAGAVDLIEEEEFSVPNQEGTSRNDGTNATGLNTTNAQ